MDAPAFFQHRFPVYLFSIYTRINDDITYLTDPESAVKEMFECMQDKIQKVIRVAKCIDRDSLYLLLDLPHKGVFEKVIKASISV